MKKNPFRKPFIAVCLMLAVLNFMACPFKKVKTSDLEKAFDYTGQIADAGDRAVIGVGDLFQAKVISYELKEKILAKIKLIKENNRRAITVLSELKERFPAGVPDAEISALDIFFDQNVLSHLAQIIIDAAELSPATAQKILLAIAFLKQIIFTVSGFFGQWSKSSVSFIQMNQLKENYNV